MSGRKIGKREGGGLNDLMRFFGVCLGESKEGKIESAGILKVPVKRCESMPLLVSHLGSLLSLP